MTHHADVDDCCMNHSQPLDTEISEAASLIIWLEGNEAQRVAIESVCCVDHDGRHVAISIAKDQCGAFVEAR
jgi:hypothetical protein